MALTELEKAAARIDKLVKLNEEKTNENKRLARTNSKLDNELELERGKLALFAAHKAKEQTIPSWLITSKTTKIHRATAVQMLSDLHFGEVQPPHEVGGYNAYSDKIAEMRLRTVCESSIQLLTQHTKGIEFDSVVVAGAGDYITGTIHDELTKTNSETVFETVVRWVGPLTAFIQAYADTFGKVFVPMVQGNHDRSTHKVESKRGPQESISWILCHWLADTFKNDKRVVFYIAPSWDMDFKIYNTNFTLTHGYGTPAGGPAGAVNSMMKEKHKYDIRNGVAKTASDWLLMGHLHQTIFAQGAIMSGCLKGMDAYAWGLKCKPEAPSQALFLVTPERGVTTRTPVYAEATGERKLWPKVQYGRNV